MLTEKQFNKLYAHYCKFFGGSEEPRIIHPAVNDPKGLHIDLVIFPPTQENPWQTVCTIGASEYAMKHTPGNLTNRNEFVTFVPADWHVKDETWLLNMLFGTATYAPMTGETISYGHSLDLSIDLENAPENVNMTGVALLFPQVCSPDVLRCKTGLFSTATILHMMPITRAEMAEQMKSPDFCSERFYPHDEPDEAMTFLCARSR